MEEDANSSTPDAADYVHPLCPQRPARNISNKNHGSSHPRPWTTAEDLTDPTFSTFTIVGENPLFHVCDEIEIRIEARNGRNESKGYGGDYFMIKVVSADRTLRAGTSTDGEVVDHGNGTYSGFVTLKWTGNHRVSVLLDQESEATYLLDEYHKHKPMRYNFSGMYVSSQVPSLKEEVLCNFMPFDKEVF